MLKLPITRAHLTTLAALTLVASPLVSAAPAVTATASAATVESHYVSPQGSDANPGTAAAPLRTLKKALTRLTPGDTLYVRGGRYRERVTSTPVVAGTAGARITVRAYPGERPVLKGLLWLKNASYWRIDGLNVTWDPSTGKRSEHMVKLTGGTGWAFTGAEVWGARSYAAVLVTGTARDWRVARNYVHDTMTSNGTNQDHLVYVNTIGTGRGLVERNVLVRSANGRAVKVGPASADKGGVTNVVIRYNSMFDNRGPSNVQLAWRTSGVSVYRNIMSAPAQGRSAVTAYHLAGTRNVVTDNLAWGTTRVLDRGAAGLADGGGNRIADPRFRNAARSDFRTLSKLAYGRYA